MKTSSTPHLNNITIGVPQLKLLEVLCLASGVSGDEEEVRDIVLKEVKPYADEVRVDALGNVLARKRAASKDGFKVMVAAHMDEVGFILTESEEGGFFQFRTVGGVDIRQVPAKPVWIGRKHVPGIIGAKPIHLQEAEDRKHPISLESMRIDIGPESNEGVVLGDRAVFATPFRREGKVIFAKALDNRLGVATLIELLESAPKSIELQAAFTVQEEVGLRGARVAAYALHPDVGIALDSTPAYDLPDPDGDENTVYNTRLGEGPSIYLSDSGTLSDPRLVQFAAHIAEENDIPFQFRQPGGGGTDATAIHKQRGGIPSLSISIPHRYSHTAVSVARVDDWQNTLRLMVEILGSISGKVFREERP
jgi:putative aminopeptidase FrvX